jgi:IS5 family transposase
MILSDLKKKKKLSNQTHVSKTDPDAILARKAATEQSLKYKIHTTIDSKSRIILDCHATTGAQHDSKVYLQKVNYIKNNFDIKITAVIADRAYGSGEIIDKLNRDGIIPFIPLFNRACGKIEGNNDFIYDSKNDRYICPKDKLLKPSINTKTGIKLYISLLKDCSKCPLNNNCVDKKLKRKRICRSIYQEIYEKNFKIINSTQFFHKLKERFWKIEEINAEAKNLHSLKRAHFRTCQKVQIQAYLVASVQNIKRLINHNINITKKF